MAAEERDMNPDPITGEPGSHPVGTGIGATGGAVAGAAMGAIGGPVGMALGGVVGAVVGGLTGKAAAEAINPSVEEAHWRENYDKEPYYENGRSFDDYGPAYNHGLSGRTRYEDDWDMAEPRLASEWHSARGGSSLSWQQAQPASRAAWDRVSPGRSGSSGFAGVIGTSRSDSVGSDGTMGAGRMGDRTGAAGYADTGASTGGSQYTGSGVGSGSRHTGMGDTGTRGTAASVGDMQTSGNNTGERDDVVDVLQDLVECCKDGEYGFQACADQSDRQDLKSLFLQRADDCRRGAQELNQHIRGLGGEIEDSGSAAGAVHRGWVSVKATFSAYDDKAVLEESERGEDNALARYRKALKKNLPSDAKQIVERQMHGVQKNHDQIKMLRDQFRAAS